MKSPLEYKTVSDKAIDIHKALQMIIEEHLQVAQQLPLDQFEDIMDVINTSKKIFLLGAGRTGFMIKAAAMRLMHLGYTVYVVGETITPAITTGDLLIVASGSGTTQTIVKAAQTAQINGANIVCFTTNPNAPLSQISNYKILIPAAGKQEKENNVSQQYAGSLFEQSFLLIFDAIIQDLWNRSGVSHDELWKRHANME